ncbi:regulatory associated protein of mTOR, partial [Tremellales sp. Uapishka_1]
MLFDILTWAGASSCYVWDCQHAGRFIRAATSETEEIDNQLRGAAAQDPSVAELHPAVYTQRQIHFAACGPHQVVPRVPGLPDDLFTACLITPLRMALLYHNLQTFPLTTSDSENYAPKSAGYMAMLWDNMSPKLIDRLGSELFSIVHTIAWQALDGPEYQKLFGQSGDVVSRLAGGFLLSQRVMATYRTTPESLPAIPSSTSHALWTTWDLILDNLFQQLPESFNPNHVDTSWEEDIKLVSFMSDQLESILTSDQNLLQFASSSPGSSAGLARLPIICQAAQTEVFREKACTALDACLKNEDIKGITHAVQGGALDVAAHLLALNDPKISSQMISIWASLIRRESCVATLAERGLTAERLTSVPCVRFFLDNLEIHLDQGERGINTVIQTTAILSTIANFVAGRQAPRFVAGTLEMASGMLKRQENLVQQWGAILAAEVVGSITGSYSEEELLKRVEVQLFGQLDSDIVETRATAVYALNRWVSRFQIQDVLEMRPSLDLGCKFLEQVRLDASPLVRKEIANLFERILRRGGVWTTLAIWTCFLQDALKDVPRAAPELTGFLRDMGAQMDIDANRYQALALLSRLFRVFGGLRNDPGRKVSSMINSSLRVLTNDLRTYTDARKWGRIFQTAFPGDQHEERWTEELCEALRQAGESLAKEWIQRRAVKPTERIEPNSNLFEKTKLSLQYYLAMRNAPVAGPEQPKSQPQTPYERTWILRHRVLEDSLVVAEQQLGLPWNWAMKDISSPDPWSTIACHSFLNSVLSCNDSHSVLVWDWSTSRKIGQINIDLSPSTVVTSARFVNELHEQTVILAATSAGTVHVFSGQPSEPDRIKPISSFQALKITMPSTDDGTHRLVSTWWRQSGKYCVGGPAKIVNVWDCPAERCIQTLETNSAVPLTTLVTEPVAGNIIFAGTADGIVKLYDMRQQRKGSMLSWQGDCSTTVPTGKSILKVGVVLGENSTVTSACANGMLNIHDLRQLSQPVAFKLAHPEGMSSASFQAHSGLMSTISNLNPKARDRSSPLDISPHSLDETTPRANFGIFRSTVEELVTVTEDQILFGPQQMDVLEKKFKPYTAMHPLRPFTAIGYGRTSFLRGAGVGKGDNTDSGSYSFLRDQAKFMT